MKKYLAFLLGVASLLTLFTVYTSVNAQIIPRKTVSTQISPINDGVTEEQYEKNITGVTPISLNQYLQKVSNGDKFISYIGFKSCPHCRRLSPILKEFIQKANQPIYYLDYGQTGTFTTATKTMINNFYNSFNQPFEFAGTPTVALYNKGKLISMTVGDDTTLNDLTLLLNDSNSNN
ncbi:PedC/BrcD family bacteriocin maturation disulfide isomerase [Dellaglioa sp. BT-FLS60]